MKRNRTASVIIRQMLRASLDSTVPLTKVSRLSSPPSLRAFASQAASQTRGPVSYVSLAITMATGAGVLYWYQQEKAKKLEAISSKSVVVGQAAIGGPFSLIDHKGKPFTEKDLLGSFSMMYFGFTHCPDICPEELEKVAEAVDIAIQNTGIDSKGLVPVFITVDPERDGPRQVGEYAKEFHPRMIALTGSPEAVKEAAKAYRVYYTKAGLAELSGSSKSNRKKQKDDDYLIDHSIITYLIDPDGKFVTFYGKNYTVDEMAQSLVGHLTSWKKKNPDWMK